MSNTFKRLFFLNDLANLKEAPSMESANLWGTLALVFLAVNIAVAQEENGKKMSPAGTHIPVLLTAVLRTQGQILEMGCGDFSTPLLHAICIKSHRTLVTAENDLLWMNLFADLKTPWHTFIYATDWTSIGKDTHWGLVFIDHAPAEQRIVDIARLRNNTDVFVMHDTETEGSYNWSKILPTFKYQFTYKRYPTWTSVVSDTIDVTQFFQD